jgi:hypothetical protein
MTKVFARFARKERLNDRRLCEAIMRAERGSIDADLSATLIKQRLPRPGGGRSHRACRASATGERRRSPPPVAIARAPCRNPMARASSHRQSCTGGFHAPPSELRMRLLAISDLSRCPREPGVLSCPVCPAGMGGEAAYAGHYRGTCQAFRMVKIRLRSVHCRPA